MRTICGDAYKMPKTLTNRASKNVTANLARYFMLTCESELTMISGLPRYNATGFAEIISDDFPVLHG
jgi:hypothetical protein